MWAWSCWKVTTEMTEKDVGGGGHGALGLAGLIPIAYRHGEHACDGAGRSVPQQHGAHAALSRRDERDRQWLSISATMTCVDAPMTA
jgi:hypothetical protein